MAPDPSVSDEGAGSELINRSEQVALVGLISGTRIVFRRWGGGGEKKSVLLRGDQWK